MKPLNQFARKLFSYFIICASRLQRGSSGSALACCMAGPSSNPGSREVFPPERLSNERKERCLGEWMNVLYECMKKKIFQAVCGGGSLAFEPRAAQNVLSHQQLDGAQSVPAAAVASSRSSQLFLPTPRIWIQGSPLYSP